MEIEFFYIFCLPLFCKFAKFVVSQVVMLDVQSGGLSEEGK
jgi:hypothetical protein